MTIRQAAISLSILLASIAVGVAGFFGTAFLFDSMNWCCFHSWAMVHGTGVVVFLCWAYLGFHGVKLAMKARDQFAHIPNLAYVCTAVGTYDYTGLWPGLLVAGYGVFRRVRLGEREGAGLLWAAVVVSLVQLAYRIRMMLLFAGYLR